MAGSLLTPSWGDPSPKRSWWGTVSLMLVRATDRKKSCTIPVIFLQWAAQLNLSPGDQNQVHSVAKFQPRGLMSPRLYHHCHHKYLCSQHLREKDFMDAYLGILQTLSPDVWPIYIHWHFGILPMLSICTQKLGQGLKIVIYFGGRRLP